MSIFVRKNVQKDAATDSLGVWAADFKRASSKKNLTPQDKKVLTVAQSIARQSIESLNGSETHGHIWAAVNEGKICAILIGDDGKNEIIIRLLVANSLDPSAKGAGTFLANEVIRLALATKRTVRTTPENAEKYWKKMGFIPDPRDSIQYIYTGGKV